jgi:glycosyltransferase involved in cell wall biosynthesis
MKINYISYFDPLLHKGGGEAIAFDVLKTGKDLGHTFTFSTVRPLKKIEFDESADLDLIVDLFNYPSTLKSLGAWLDFPLEFKRKILLRKRFIHLNNAYVDVCNESYLPCSGNSQPICPEKSTMYFRKNFIAKDFELGCFAKRELARDFFTHSKLNIFLSPLHQKTANDILGVLNEAPSYILKPTINPDIFYDQHIDRDIEYLFVGVISEAKGLFEMRKRYLNADIHFAGRVHPQAKLDFGTYHGSMSYKEVPYLMNRAKNFVFLPRWPEPQGRVVIEAALCGCKLITNDRVGATSFDFDIRNPLNFSNATEELWKRIEEIV